jgi:hypothetical protein
MPILVGIDGTGDAMSPGAARDAAYDRDFAKSFVHRICSGKPRAKYLRGPVALGGGLLQAIAEGVTFVVAQKKQVPREPVLLTGYSRGATGAVVIAKRLKELNIRVRALMLFDCVDRHIAVDAHAIPNNVDYVNHVKRSPRARSRMTFSNDAIAFTPPTIYPTPKEYFCTHGAMGGMPWTPAAGQSANDYVDEGTMEALMSPTRREPVWEYHTYVTFAQDDAASKQIWRDVQPFLATHKF